MNWFLIALFSFVFVGNKFENVNRFILQTLQTPDAVFAAQVGPHACRMFFEDDKRELVGRGRTKADAKKNLERRCLIYLCQKSDCENFETRFSNYDTCSDDDGVICIRN